jgi:DNA-binding transcriptional MocR family regulator
VTSLEHTVLVGRTAREIAASVERAVVAGRLAPGDRLPTVRALAARLAVSPATVASAYRDLNRHGLTEGAGRRGTRVAHGPPVGPPGHGIGQPPVTPAGVVDLASGYPDSRLLPKLWPLERLARAAAGNYDAAVNDPVLLEMAGERFAADGIPDDHLAVVGGALDGVERVLMAHLHPGDRVGVEDPGFPPLFDLLRALGLRIVPIAVDDGGLRPDGPGGLAGALDRGLDALVVTPRGQNPTGAAIGRERARTIRRALGERPGLLVVEDDHAVPVAGADASTLWSRRRQRWAVIRSVSKALGPDLRVAVMAADELTVARVAGRQALGTGWVSSILQRVVADLWSDPATDDLVHRATETYTTRRRRLVGLLAAKGIASHGRSGLNVWVPVDDEPAVAGGLREAGWQVAAGERYRITSRPAIRVTIASLDQAGARRFSADLVAVLDRPLRARRRVRT